MFRLFSLRGNSAWIAGGILSSVSMFAGLVASGSDPRHQDVPVELVLLDADGDGFRLCPVDPPARVGFGSRDILVRAWTCAGDDDGWILLANEGRPPSIADVLGLKVGPESGFDHLALKGGGDRRTQVNSSESWFKYLLLWQDADSNRVIGDTELAGLQYLGFDRIVLTSNRSGDTPAHAGAIVTRRGTAIRSGLSYEMVSLRFPAQ